MNAVFSILLLAAILGFIVFLLAKQDKGRRILFCRQHNGKF